MKRYLIQTFETFFSCVSYFAQCGCSHFYGIFNYKMTFGARIVFSVSIVVCALGIVDSSNILGFFSTPSRSHYIIDETFMKGLAAKGHNVSKTSKIKTEIFHNNDVPVNCQ